MHLAEIARGADTTSQQLFNVGAADRPDVLEAQIELDRSEIELVEAENDLGRAWLMLAAVVGEPTLERPHLEGDLESGWPQFDEGAALAELDKLLRASPELKKARAGIERARAMLQRAKAEPVPDVLSRGGIGYNNEFSEFLGEVAPEAFIEVGFRVPLFDRNHSPRSRQMAFRVPARLHRSHRETGDPYCLSIPSNRLDFQNSGVDRPCGGRCREGGERVPDRASALGRQKAELDQPAPAHFGEGLKPLPQSVVRPDDVDEGPELLYLESQLSSRGGKRRPTSGSLAPSFHSKR